MSDPARHREAPRVRADPRLCGTIDAVQSGDPDGIGWSGITEGYTVGWADVTNDFLTDDISGAWAGSFFTDMERWEELPEDLQTLFRVCCDQPHHYRQWWYWGGEARLRVHGDKLELISIPDTEWTTVEAVLARFVDNALACAEWEVARGFERA